MSDVGLTFRKTAEVLTQMDPSVRRGRWRVAGRGGTIVEVDLDTYLRWCDVVDADLTRKFEDGGYAVADDKGEGWWVSTKFMGGPVSTRAPSPFHTIWNGPTGLGSKRNTDPKSALEFHRTQAEKLAKDSKLSTVELGLLAAERILEADIPTVEDARAAAASVALIRAGMVSAVNGLDKVCIYLDELRVGKVKPADVTSVLRMLQQLTTSLKLRLLTEED